MLGIKQWIYSYKNKAYRYFTILVVHLLRVLYKNVFLRTRPKLAGNNLPYLFSEFSLSSSLSMQNRKRTEWFPYLGVVYMNSD